MATWSSLRALCDSGAPSSSGISLIFSSNTLQLSKFSDTLEASNANIHVLTYLRAEEHHRKISHCMREVCSDSRVRDVAMKHWNDPSTRVGRGDNHFFKHAGGGGLLGPQTGGEDAIREHSIH